MSRIFGRKEEQRTLEKIVRSTKAEFLALYGRRRVGKTFLIENYFKKSVSYVFFHATGIKNGKMKEQLREFTNEISNVFYDGVELKVLTDWFETFNLLNQVVTKLPRNKKMVLFFDEFPWMATRRSRLLLALEYYWNRYWHNDKRIKLIICGSSASWILEKIVHNTGGLYNRITHSMELEPFTLKESEKFLKAKGITLKRKQLVMLYMVMGGIPLYLDNIVRGKTAAQIIEDLCFRKNGFLFGEFEKLFASLFDESEVYLHLIEVVSRHRNGISLSRLLELCDISSGGRIRHRLKELEEAGFIIGFIPYGHKEKGSYYKVIDEYTLFYQHWIKAYKNTLGRKANIPGYWQKQIHTPKYFNWAGYAYESICYKHIRQIHDALAIPDGSLSGSWKYSPRGDGDQGAQIDLLFDRPDDAVTVCEIKYTKEPFCLDKAYSEQLKTKLAVYRKVTRSSKQLFLVLITADKIKESKYSKVLIDGNVVMEDLFA